MPPWLEAKLGDCSISNSLWLCRLRILFFPIWRPRIRIGGGVGVHAEGPDVEVHAFRSLRFDNGVFTGRKVRRGSQLEPSGADAVDGSLHGVLFLTGLAGGGALDIADNALAVFYFQVNDAEAVKGDDGLLGLLRLLGAGAGSVETGLGRLSRSGLAGRRRGFRRFVLIILDVDGRYGDMGVDRCVFAIEFNGCLGAVDGGTKDVGLGVAVDIALVLLNFNQLRLALEVIEQKHSGKFRQSQAGSDLGKARLLGFTVGVGFLIDEGGFGDGWRGSAVFLVLLGGGPIDERGWEFFPFFALSAEVADTVAMDFIFRDGLIGAVFEDEVAGELLSRGMYGECENGEHKCCHQNAR